MKEISNLPNYLISKDGKVWSNLRKKYIFLDQSSPYTRCKIKGKNFSIHRLLWMYDRMTSNKTNIKIQY